LLERRLGVVTVYRVTEAGQTAAAQAYAKESF